MINIAELITDPDFCQSMQIVRRKGQWKDGLFTITEEPFLSYGVIDPENKSKDLSNQPSGDLLNGSVTFYAHDKLYLTSHNEEFSTNYVSDEIVWMDKRWMISDVKDYSDYGYYQYSCKLKDPSGEENESEH